MHVLIVTHEVSPFCPEGGTGELAGTLARALRESGHRVTLISPFHREINADRFGLARRIRKLQLTLGGQRRVEVGLLDGKFPSSDVQLVFVDHEMYQEPQGTSEPRRHELLCRSAACVADELALDPDVLHAVGWQSGLTLLFARDATEGSALARARRVLTFHDVGGVFERSTLDELGLDAGLFTPQGIEFHGKVSLLKAGVLGADMVCTTSPARARELRTVEHGGGLHGLFQSLGDRLAGVQGGIDYGVWDPSSDHRIAERYEADHIEGKAACKRALQQQLGLPPRPAPLVVQLAPFGQGSGLGRVLDALLRWPDGEGALQIGVVGGDESTASRVAAVENRPNLTLGHLGAAVDGDNLHRLLAGADALLVPPLSDPGSHLPLKALRYGAIPLVNRVGGLADAVVDFDAPSGSGTGITFLHENPEGLLTALHRLVTAHASPESWSALTANAMRQRFPTERLARRYLEVYG